MPSGLYFFSPAAKGALLQHNLMRIECCIYNNEFFHSQEKYAEEIVLIGM
jgi:hypothetical protein